MDIQSRLKNFGYEVVETVPSGEKAIEQVKEIKPDLILMDINLKGNIDGIKTAEKIKTLFDIPVIYMSAFNDKGTFERIKRSNPYGFINKPISTDFLIISIDTAIYKHDLDKKLVEREERLRSIFDSTKDAIFSFDLEGKFTSANKNLYNKLKLMKMN